MSHESWKYRQGLKRGKAGKNDAESLIDVDRLFDTDADRAARQRGYEAGAAARATAEAITAQRTSSQDSYVAAPDNKPLFLLRRWFPELFPWSEQAASYHIMNAVMMLCVIGGALLGLYYGYSQAGIGAAILSGILLGGVGVFAGWLFGLFGSVIITMILNAIIVLAPITLAIWVLLLIWNAKL